MKKSSYIKTTTIYDEKAYFDFSKSHYLFLLRKRKWWFIAFLILSIPLILASLFSALKIPSFAIFFFLLDLLIVIEIFTDLIPKWQVKRMISQNPSILDHKNTYIFHQDSFEVQNIEGNYHYLYTELYQVIESEQYFYLYQNKIAAFLVDKSHLTKKEIAGLQEILKSYELKCYWTIPQKRK